MEENTSTEVVAEGLFNTQGAPEQAAESQSSEETPKVEAKAPAEDPKFAAKFAALTRKEREIRQREQQVAARLAEAEKKAKELEEVSKNSNSYKDKMKSNIFKFLEEEGFTYEQLLEMKLNDDNPTTDMKLARAQKEIEEKALSKIEQLEKQLKDREEREARERYEAVVSNFKNEIKSTVDSNADTYELVKANEAYDLVFEVMEEYYKQTSEIDESGTLIKPGKILAVPDAVAEVERHLENEAKKILELKKFKQTSPKPASPKPDEKKAAPTLSNTLSSQVPSKGERKLSNEDSLKEAAKLIRWME